jgi:ribonuclease HII
VAGCVIFGVLPLGSPKAFPPANKLGAPSLGPPASRHPLVVINDSKQLSSKQREIADIWIRKNALAWGIGQASVSEINGLGIKKATEIAFRKAIKNCRTKIDYLLIDAFYIPYVRGLRHKNQLPIIKGDTKSISIAAASIVAKVYRDKIMVKLSQNPKYKKYKWDKNKGYGTLEHRETIKKYGTTRLHRKQFVDTWLSNL